MLRTTENESEILLGNKQLLGIFVAVAVLLGVAFAGGYVVGHGGTGKKVIAATEPTTDTASSRETAGGQTHTLEGEPNLPARELADPSTTASNSAEPVNEAPRNAEPVLGSHKDSKKPAALASEPAEPELKHVGQETGYAPHAGSQYLQVAAVGRDEAEAVADVLHKKGFHAHAVPKPGNPKLYRVIIGPVKDASDLSSTRDSLRKTGFREVIVQRY